MSHKNCTNKCNHPSKEIPEQHVYVPATELKETRDSFEAISDALADAIKEIEAQDALIAAQMQYIEMLQNRE